jgi:NADH-quinone oxidoreductase subunit C
MILWNKFIGHPQLKILNMDEMISFLCERFPMEDSGRTDKDDRFFGREQPNNVKTNNI